MERRVSGLGVTRPRRLRLVLLVGSGVGVLVWLLALHASPSSFTSRAAVVETKCCIWPTQPLVKVPPPSSALSFVHPSFERYGEEHTGVPTWIVSTLGRRGNERASKSSVIHRFFDSSPFSPSGRYLAASRLPAPQPSADLRQQLSSVLVIDLQRGKEHVVAHTQAWGAQTGAHVQWGGSDDELFFNQMGSGVGGTGGSGGGLQVHGVIYSIEARKVVRTLPCAIYHVTLDGKFTAAPHMRKIRNTQFGYGADYVASDGAGGARRVRVRSASASVNTNANANANANDNANVNANAPTTDGLFVNNVETSECRLLVSLYEFAVAAGLDTTATPMYGFHTKWSQDGQRLLFVMRSLERAQGLQGSLLDYRVRRQHLFALHADGSHVRHLLSWSSKSFEGGGSEDSGEEDGLGEDDDEFDGNHPSWVPGSHNVSINIKTKGQAAQPWKLVVFDTDAVYESRVALGPASWQEAYAPSSGHPSVAPGGRFALLDVYTKERVSFGSFSEQAVPAWWNASAAATTKRKQQQAAGPFAPLRLVDAQSRREVWLLQAQLLPDAENAKDQSISDPSVPNKEKRAWRCDMHPAFSRGGDWVAFNARPNGAEREILIAHVGQDLSLYFG